MANQLGSLSFSVPFSPLFRKNYILFSITQTLFLPLSLSPFTHIWFLLSFSLSLTYILPLSLILSLFYRHIQTHARTHRRICDHKLRNVKTPRSSRGLSKKDKDKNKLYLIMFCRTSASAKRQQLPSMDRRCIHRTEQSQAMIQEHHALEGNRQQGPGQWSENLVQALSDRGTEVIVHLGIGKVALLPSA